MASELERAFPFPRDNGSGVAWHTERTTRRVVIEVDDENGEPCIDVSFQQLVNGEWIDREGVSYLPAESYAEAFTYAHLWIEDGVVRVD